MIANDTMVANNTKQLTSFLKARNASTLLSPTEDVAVATHPFCSAGAAVAALFTDGGEGREP